VGDVSHVTYCEESSNWSTTVRQRMPSSRLTTKVIWYLIPQMSNDSSKLGSTTTVTSAPLATGLSRKS